MLFLVNKVCGGRQIIITGILREIRSPVAAKSFLDSRSKNPVRLPAFPAEITSTTQNFISIIKFKKQQTMRIEAKKY